MALRNIQKNLWHAFNALDVTNSGKVQKSRLKVLSNNVGQAFGKEKTEEILNEKEESDLSFEEFFSVFEEKVLKEVEELNVENQKNSVDKVENICWLLCGNKYSKQLEEDKTREGNLSHDDIYKLWQIFNFFTEICANGQLLLPLRIDIEEVRRIIQLLCQTLGLCELGRWKINNNDVVLVDFVSFVHYIEQAFPEPGNDLSQGIKEIRNDILHDILKKGYLVKYGNRVTTWKERWFILYCKCLMYYTSQYLGGGKEEDIDSKGNIEINTETKVESIPDKPGSKPNRFFVKVPGRNYELCAPDLRSKNEWISAIQKAIKHSGEDYNFQYQSWIERKEERENRRKATAEDELKKQQEQELIERQKRELEEQRLRNLQDQELLEKRRKELESEKLAREEIEAKLKEEEQLRLAEQERLRELQEIKADLEKLLEDERQAKRDEEIVRNLQSRILEEEFAKRKELEKIKEEQDKLLDEERHQRVDLENKRQEQEQMIRDAQMKLEELEKERSDADLKLNEAMEKMKIAEQERYKMEHKLKLRVTNNCVGLARPKFVSDPSPYTTHRGKGAFSEADFQKSPAKVENDEASGDDLGTVFE
ncbi:hypothetical protein LOTGIDRAFT_231610 [Lottia gigantea]|uniref:PH domain-containing protein n=1 Tax=Lottia gigantea TaxID=225164 RepID=V4C707_LOTGI|nr:hypothetical protein LOTGIDRAFT_231610 [Lottia gigantea]ESO97449.1 hypothetical protein LOTGIDRAFT_231610 [Lottia gigantea]